MAVQTPPPRPRGTQLDQIDEPVMHVTHYDRTSSMMIAVIIGLVLLLVWLMAVWFTNLRPAVDDTAPIEMIQLGGWEDGAPDETLEVDSPDPETPDPSLAQIEDPVEQKQELVETVLEQSEVATQLAERQFENAAVTTGKPGSATGNGRRPLGVGGGGAGVPPEQRWFIRFNDRDTLQEYAKALDFFNIEVMLVDLKRKRLFAVTNLANSKPTVTEHTQTGKYKHLLNFNWQSGSRRLADGKLLKKAGLDASRGTILHIYNQKLERDLATLEFNYKKQPIRNIRRTYFLVRPRGSGFEFVVTRQLLLQ